MHQFAQEHEIDIAVNEAHTRRPERLIRVSQMQARLVAAPLGLERHIGREAGEVREQVADGDGALAALEFGNVFGDSVVEPELPLLEELHE